MPERRIHPTDETLSPLSLPPAALSRGDRGYGYGVKRQPPAIEPIEHRIRLDFTAGGPIQRSSLLDRYNPWTSGPADPDPWRSSGRTKPQGLIYAEASCRRALEQERPYYEQVATITDSRRHRPFWPIDFEPVGMPKTHRVSLRPNANVARTGIRRSSRG
jgi:hypothetical protein